MPRSVLVCVSATQCYLPRSASGSRGGVKTLMSEGDERSRSSVPDVQAAETLMKVTAVDQEFGCTITLPDARSSAAVLPFHDSPSSVELTLSDAPAEEEKSEGFGRLVEGSIAADSTDKQRNLSKAVVAGARLQRRVACVALLTGIFVAILSVILSKDISDFANLPNEAVEFLGPLRTLGLMIVCLSLLPTFSFSVRFVSILFIVCFAVAALYGAFIAARNFDECLKCTAKAANATSANTSAATPSTAKGYDHDDGVRDCALRFTSDVIRVLALVASVGQLLACIHIRRRFVPEGRLSQQQTQPELQRTQQSQQALQQTQQSQPQLVQQTQQSQPQLKRHPSGSGESGSGGVDGSSARHASRQISREISDRVDELSHTMRDACSCVEFVLGPRPALRHVWTAARLLACGSGLAALPVALTHKQTCVADARSVDL
jgi:hypothetical protein